jgi:hypothetical protein
MEEEMRTMKAIRSCVCGAILSPLAIILLSISFTGLSFGQTPNSGLQLLTFIPVPNWLPSNVSVDLSSFNPQTKILYFADRVNHGATAIDTTTWRVLGTVVTPGVPDCLTATPPCSPSGVLVIPDLQKLVITTRDTHTFIYNLRIPGSPPTDITVPSGADETEYDPIHHRIYFGNTNPPLGVVAIDAITEKLLGQIVLPDNGSPEQPRFNPNDGLIYQSSPGDNATNPNGQGVFVIDPNQGPAGAIVKFFQTPIACRPHAIDIDPLTNVAMLGCSAQTGTNSLMMNLADGTILGGVPADGNDLGYFNRNTRHWYFGMANNNHPESGCPAAQGGTPLSGSTPRYPAVAVIGENISSSGAVTPQFVGFACSGRGGSKIGFDPTTNNVYAQVTQYPPDTSSSTSGRGGVLVFHDPGADQSGTPASTVEAHSTANLTAVAGSGVTGTVDITLRRRNMEVEAGLNGLPAGIALTNLVVTTTVGDEVIPCGVDGTGKGFCGGHTVGDPLIGGVVDVSYNNRFVASGKITLLSTITVPIPIDAVKPAQ